MKIYRGVAASSGLAVGPLIFLASQESALQNIKSADPQAEWRRFEQAQSKAMEQLEALRRRAESQGQEDAAVLMDAHIEMAQDPDFTDTIRAEIEDGYAAEIAVQHAGEQFAAMFAGMEDSYMQARSADILDIADRIVNLLSGRETEMPPLTEPCILAADDLTPSQTLQLDQSLVLGIVTKRGSVQSHSAILARMLGIPALVGVDKLSADDQHRQVILDGDAGTLCLDPDEDARRRYREKAQTQLDQKASLSPLKGLASVTSGGKQIRLYCNIASPEDVNAVQENGGEGIGLFRSEFLFLGRQAMPSEAEQCAAYRAVLEKMGQKRVIIRTLDIGADKKADYLSLSAEENPAMGLRGLRLCLENPDLFTTQLRALYRASVFGNLAIMFPMITDLWEFEEARSLCRAVQAQLCAEGISFSPQVPLGVMLETPGAVMVSDRLAREADFFSVGTNDLTQYALACDRQNPSIARFYRPYHPAVLQFLRLAAQNAHAASIPIGICGELAGDPQMLDFFLDIGIDELSVAPPRVLPLRQLIRSR